MGLLDALYSLSAKAQTAGAKAYEKAGYYDLMDRLRQRQMQAQQDMALQGQQAQYAQEASRLKPMLSRYGGDFAKEVGSGLLSGSPEVRAAAAEKLQAAEVKRGIAPESVLARLQSQTLQNTATAQGITQNEQAGPLQLQAIRANIAQSQASAANSRAQAAAAGQANTAQLAGQLRDDFSGNPLVSDWQDSWQSVKQLRASLRSGSAVGAQGAIIKLARIYDPGGVVREAEGDVYRGSMGALNALQNSLSAAKGKGFNPQTIQDIENLTDDLLKSTLPGVEAIVDQFTGTAIRNGVNPQDVIVMGVDQEDFRQWQERLKRREGVHQWGGLIQRGPGGGP